jgi:hypothetical protein
MFKFHRPRHRFEVSSHGAAAVIGILLILVLVAWLRGLTRGLSQRLNRPPPARRRIMANQFVVQLKNSLAGWRP